MYQLGVDTGGTFTDAVLKDAGGRAWPIKVPTTLEPEFGFLDAVAQVTASTGLDGAEVRGEIGRIMYGTTIATNIAVQRNGAHVGLLTTQGFGDTILIMQGHGYAAGVPDEVVTHIQELGKPDPLVPRERIREVTERVDAQGTVVVGLDEPAARRAIRELVGQGVEAFAVCFLWSFLNDRHERRMREILADEAPGAFVTLSSELAPRAGEYTRTVATAINAFTGPAVARHVDVLERAIVDDGVDAHLNILHCGGGVFTPDEASLAPVKLIGSGPVGGVLASRNLGATLGVQDILTTDMGGTTFDVGIIVDGKPVSRSTSVVGQYEYMVPTVDIQSIGSGGGSLVWVDETSRTIRVGPQSAGSVPGPACYGRGGTHPTVTDCDLVVGYLNPDNFLGGGLTLDLARAVDAIEQHVAGPLGITVIEAAKGALRIVDVQMAELIRQMTVGRGHDPRDFTIFAFGGAGPLHAAGFSGELGAQGVVVPGGPLASVWSAYGAVTSDTVLVLERAHAQRAPLNASAIEAAYRGLEDEARERLAAAAGSDDAVEIRRTADLRYGMQVHVVEVEIPGAIDEQNVEQILDRFHARYAELFGAGTGFRAAGVEMTAIRIEAVVPNATGPTSEALAVDPRPLPAASLPSRRVHWPADEGPSETAIATEGQLVAGATVAGPAILELSTTTIPVPRGWHAQVDGTGSIRLASDEAEVAA